MKTLDRYVAKELTLPVLIGTVVFTLLFVANDAIAVFKALNVTVIPLEAILRALILKAPYWVLLTVPIGTTLAASLAVNRLARDSEITAIKAAGTPQGRVIVPVLAFGLILAGTHFLFQEHVVPKSLKEYRAIAAEIGILGSLPEFQANVTFKLDRFSANVGTISREPDSTLVLRDIVLYERPRQGETIIHVSPTGRYSAGVWTLETPRIMTIGGDALTLLDSKGPVVINEPIRIVDLFQAQMPEEQTLADITESIRRLNLTGQDPRRLHLLYHTRIASSVSCFVFALVACALTATMSRYGPFVGVIASLTAVWVYFNLYIVSTEVVGRLSTIDPSLAAWLPNALFLLGGLMSLRSQE